MAFLGATFQMVKLVGIQEIPTFVSRKMPPCRTPKRIYNGMYIIYIACVQHRLTYVWHLVSRLRKRLASESSLDIIPMRWIYQVRSYWSHTVTLISDFSQTNLIFCTFCSAVQVKNSRCVWCRPLCPRTRFPRHDEIKVTLYLTQVRSLKMSIGLGLRFGNIVLAVKCAWKSEWF